MSSDKSVSEKVVILGGGVGGVTAAFALTQPELNGRYDVTLYQMGWRLGGKGASGRRAAANQRIEEHGLHVWMGFYYNAFVQMKRCYDELGRDPRAPLGSFDAAFKPQAMGTLMDRDGAAWSRWEIPMPGTTDSVAGGDHPSVLGHIEMLLQWMADALKSVLLQDARREGLFKAIWHAIETLGWTGETLLRDVYCAVRDARKAGVPLADAEHRTANAVQRLAAAIRESFLGDAQLPAQTRRLLQVIDIACAAVAGLFKEGVLTRGVPFVDLDNRELRTFLRDYGCHADSLDSPVLRSFYDLGFGFRRGMNGERNEDNAAGTALDAMLRVCFGYRDAFMWRMQAGMGDTMFGPYYEVLKRRGVTFKFFHRVESLEVGQPDSAGARRIERVHLARQVDVKGGESAYQPLVDVKGLPCWPSDPDYDQIVQGDALRKGPNGAPFNLESRWSGWTDVDSKVVLQADAFAHLVLAIPVGAHPIVCGELMQASPRFDAMVKQVQTVQTFGVQIWMDRAIDAMGWPIPTVHGQPQRPVADAYADPLNSFADNSHLIAVEQWTEPLVPKTLLYFCGVLADEFPPREFPPTSDTGFPVRQALRVKQQAIDWFKAHTGPILPGACTQGAALDWSRLVDPKGREGVARFDAQYWRANVDPTERYVMSVTGSTRYRLKAGDAQFTNLVLAGDWVDTGFNTGCVESATMAGLQAARAITGDASVVFGEQTLESWQAKRPAMAPEPGDKTA